MATGVTAVISMTLIIPAKSAAVKKQTSICMSDCLLQVIG